MGERKTSDATRRKLGTIDAEMVDPKKKRPTEELEEPDSERWETADTTRKPDLGRTVPIPGSPSPPRPSKFPPRSRISEYPKRPGGPLSAGPLPSGKLGIELLIVDETQIPGGERKPWRAAEVWTKRRVYGLDSTFKCVEILDRGTGRPEIGHEMLGARLGGGRARDKDTVRFSYPLPLPGMEAMFMKGKKHGYTSAVERMIVRVRVLHTSAEDMQPTWEEIASRWSEVPPPTR